MNTQPGNDVARELAERLAAMEVKNNALQEEIERKNKSLEGFIAENEALKAELSGRTSNGDATDAVGSHNADHMGNVKQAFAPRIEMISGDLAKLQSAWTQIKAR
jgi:hypothetical protein